MSDVIDLRLLGTQVRALQRDLAMVKARLGELPSRAELQAGLAAIGDLPSVAQLEAGLSAIDGQFAELGDIIAEKVTAALSDQLGTIAARLDALEKRP